MRSGFELVKAVLSTLEMKEWHSSREVEERLRVLMWVMEYTEQDLERLLAFVKEKEEDKAV